MRNENNGLPGHAFWSVLVASGGNVPETNFLSVVQSWDMSRERPYQLLYLLGGYSLRVMQVVDCGTHWEVAGKTFTGEVLNFPIGPGIYNLFDFPLERAGIVPSDHVFYGEYCYELYRGDYSKEVEGTCDYIRFRGNHNSRSLFPDMLYRDYTTVDDYYLLDIRNGLILTQECIESNHQTFSNEGRLSSKTRTQRLAFRSRRSGTAYMADPTMDTTCFIMIPQAMLAPGRVWNGLTIHGMLGGGMLLMRSRDGLEKVLPATAILENTTGPYQNHFAKLRNWWALEDKSKL